jgi:hypothetical protein
MKTSTNYNGVVYNITDEITPNDDRAITAWVNIRNPTSKSYDVAWIVSDETLTLPANYKIKVKTTKRFEIGDTMVISRPGALNFYGKVIDDTNAVNGIYFIHIDADVIEHLNSVNTNWISAKNYKLVINDPITILDGINETETGFQVYLYANQYLKINYGTQTHVAALSSKLNDQQWYGIVVNIGNTWGQYNFYVWEVDPDNSVTKLRIKGYETMLFEPESTTVGTYSIDRSNAYLTNIRLFSTTIEEEKQVRELLSYFTKDSDQALILDNCDPRFSAPYISQQK